MGLGVFVIGLSQISSFFSSQDCPLLKITGKMVILYLTVKACDKNMSFFAL